MQTFIILLERDLDRFSHVHDILVPALSKEICSTLNVMTAVDGQTDAIEKTLSEYKIVIAEPPKGYRKLSRGQIGCFLSHYKIWDHIVKNNISSALILEDDVILTDGFSQNLQNILTELPLDWWMTYAYVHNKHRNDSVCEDQKYDFIRDAFYTYGTVGYLISLKGAKEFMKMFEIISTPIDTHISTYIKSTTPNYCYTAKKLLVDTVGQIYGRYAGEKLRSTVW